ncbi:DUF6090 family protein [Robiginitalea marina]|uniref:DUF6090 family protein n=1 Tax=Robiginitalea marina TaxID=2954105 RepID=A0ABT1B1B3_9FLAO|nr:DUF6090 family protein [Robiginitalea marina]
MFRFFRKLRQNLLAQNRVTRYLLYAVGEIVLVVIGILIALQVDTWNQWRKEREMEQMVLKQLRDDYRANLVQLDQKIRMREAIIEASLDILRAMDHPEGASRDSLISNMAILLIDPTFDPIENDFSSNGDLRLITNQKLKRLLSNWSADIVAVRELEHNWVDILKQEYVPILVNLGVNRDLAHTFLNDLEMDWALSGTARFENVAVGKAKKTVALETLTAHVPLEGLVSAALTYNTTANLESQTLRERIEEVLALIESEIR